MQKVDQRNRISSSKRRRRKRADEAGASSHPRRMGEGRRMGVEERERELVERDPSERSRKGSYTVTVTVVRGK